MGEPVTVGAVLAVVGCIIGVFIVGVVVVGILSIIAEGFKH